MEDSMRIKASHYAFPFLLGLTLLQQLDAQSVKSGGSGEQKPPSAATAQVIEDPLGRDTPRGAVLGFIKAIERENYELAAQYLDTKLKPQQRQEVAQQLGEVLNRKLSTNLDRLSRKAEGDLEDGLANNLERVGVVTRESGDVEILL